MADIKISGNNYRKSKGKKKRRERKKEKKRKEGMREGKKKGKKINELKKIEIKKNKK